LVSDSDFGAHLLEFYDGGASELVGTRGMIGRDSILSTKTNPSRFDLEMFSSSATITRRAFPSLQAVIAQRHGGERQRAQQGQPKSAG